MTIDYFDHGCFNSTGIGGAHRASVLGQSGTKVQALRRHRLNYILLVEHQPRHEYIPEHAKEGSVQRPLRQASSKSWYCPVRNAEASFHKA